MPSASSTARRLPRACADVQTPQTAHLTALQRELQAHPTRGLTPSKLARILDSAEAGDMTAQFELFEDMEEKDGHIASELNKRRRACLLEWEVARGLFEAVLSQSVKYPVVLELNSPRANAQALSDALVELANEAGGAYLLGRSFQRIGYEKELAHSIALWATIWGFVAAKVYLSIRASERHLYCG